MVVVEGEPVVDEEAAVTLAPVAIEHLRDDKREGDACGLIKGALKLREQASRLKRVQSSFKHTHTHIHISKKQRA